MRGWLELVFVSVEDSSVRPFEKTIDCDALMTDSIR